jgi:hypothetical protein
VLIFGCNVAKVEVSVEGGEEPAGGENLERSVKLGGGVGLRGSVALEGEVDVGDLGTPEGILSSGDRLKVVEDARVEEEDDDDPSTEETTAPLEQIDSAPCPTRNVVITFSPVMF